MACGTQRLHAVSSLSTPKKDTRDARRCSHSTVDGHSFDLSHTPGRHLQPLAADFGSAASGDSRFRLAERYACADDMIRGLRWAVSGRVRWGAVFDGDSVVRRQARGRPPLARHRFRGCRRRAGSGAELLNLGSRGSGRASPSADAPGADHIQAFALGTELFPLLSAKQEDQDLTYLAPRAVERCAAAAVRRLRHATRGDLARAQGPISLVPKSCVGRRPAWSEGLCVGVTSARETWALQTRAE
jgi:hypothetical protein